MPKNFIGEIAPHGGVLVDRVCTAPKREQAVARAAPLAHPDAEPGLTFPTLN